VAKRNQASRRRWQTIHRVCLGNVITIDDERIKSHLDRVVRGSVEETLNALLDAEADRLSNAQRYERSAARRNTRADHYERNLQTKAGEVRLKVPKLRDGQSSSAIGGTQPSGGPVSPSAVSEQEDTKGMKLRTGAVKMGIAPPQAIA
jgi:uncharacterized protein YllA (UPF0747 family)